MLTASYPNSAEQVPLLPGSLLWRKDLKLNAVDRYRALLQSWPPLVAHINKSVDGYLEPRVESFEAFAAGREVKAEPAPSPIPIDEMWSRVQEIARARRPFGLMAFGEAWNCESFARYVRQGIAHSVQATSAKEALAILGVVAGVVVLIALVAEA